LTLIERAASLLTEFDDPTSSAPQKTEFAAAAKRPANSLGLNQGPSRSVVLDLRRLAQFGIVVPSSQWSRTVEEFRIIKRRLLVAALESDSEEHNPFKRAVMVTSARPEEGKTFVSLNLALAFASESDTKVVLIDGDTQRQTLLARCGIDAQKGLVDILGGEADIADVLLQTDVPNLSVLPSGSFGPHVPDLLSSNRVRDLVTEITRRYSDCFIVLDSPPCLASSQTSGLAACVGQIVLVVEANRTQREEVEAAIRLIDQCAQISLLLNKTEFVPNAGFGAYYHYYQCTPNGI
jgi:exopolysaccharide/PEP-CTERM locus tyrosine autokinase